LLAGQIFLKIRPNHKNRAVNLHTIMKKRRKRKISFIVAYLILALTVNLKAQQTIFRPSEILPAKLELKGNSLSNPSLLSTSNKSSLLSDRLFLTLPVRLNPISKMIPGDFYTRNFGFFCKKELEFEKTAHIPLRFRLGSLQYCNYLEGKDNP
jgi:hypothetical protein